MHAPTLKYLVSFWRSNLVVDAFLTVSHVCNKVWTIYSTLRTLCIKNQNAWSRFVSCEQVLVVWLVERHVWLFSNASLYCNSFAFLPSPLSLPPAGRLKRLSWQRLTGKARDPNGSESPASVTSILKPTSRRRMFLECAPSSSLSNRRL